MTALLIAVALAVVVLLGAALLVPMIAGHGGIIGIGVLADT